MNTGNNEIIPFNIEDELGNPIAAEELCPGVYYVSVSNPDQPFGDEFYIIEKSNPHISKQVKRLGCELTNHPDLLFYRVGVQRSGHDLIWFEAQKYRQQNKLPVLGGESLHLLAVYGMEDYPEYFGAFPVPIVTPRGMTIRYRTLVNGVFAIETERCEKLVAVSYPLWYDGFSDYVMQYAEETDHDREAGIDQTLGSLFFPENSACLSLFELLDKLKTANAWEYVDPAAMMKAIWERFPRYAIQHNLREKAGMNDILGQVAKSIGNANSLNSSPENLLYLIENAGTDYLRF